jgi:hypothetical protein
LIESAPRPRIHVEALTEVRAKNKAPYATVLVIVGADKDARWVNKGRTSILGSGLITKIGQWPGARLQTEKPSDICRNGWRHVANLSGDQT